jgi:hypothetical protein
LQFEKVGWLWAVWFLAAPFAHFPDEILLTIPILAYLGVDGERLASASGRVALVALFGSIILFPATIANVNLLSAVVAFLTWPLWKDARRLRFESEALPNSARRMATSDSVRPRQAAIG